jgi:hypothetical protein
VLAIWKKMDIHNANTHFLIRNNETPDDLTDRRRLSK